MAHNGVDIIDYVLYTVYPTAAFFAIGYAAKITKMRQVYTFVIQALVCFAFAGYYLAAIPMGGAQGLAVILAMFGVLLLFMARKKKIEPAEEEEQKRT
ncbi:hypothetical protein [Nitrososphaera sp.]|uniref:hypothetical protein n=1 Tax=Nitrososphaera sp. TaxID=1971748 RepID=UPI00307ECD71